MRKIIKSTILSVLIFSLLFLTGCGFFQNIFGGNNIDKVYDKLFLHLDTLNIRDDFHLYTSLDNATIAYTSDNNALSIGEEEIDNKVLVTVTNPTVATVVNIGVTVSLNSNTKTTTKRMQVLSKKDVIDFTPYPFANEMTLLAKYVKDYVGYIGLPTVENPTIDTVITEKILVIPIEFPNKTFKANDLVRIRQAFFGTSLETGYESVKSYYEKSSYGSVIFDGDVLTPYQAKYNTSYYENPFRAEDADQILFKEVLEYYDDTIDFSDYDTNSDGYIDGVYLIYSQNNYGNALYPSNSDLWWAWCFYYDGNERYDNVRAGNYVWASYDFMDEAFTVSGNNIVKINVNATTYIHETGHMFGLDDYYDYDDLIGPKGGLAGADMMDGNMGDHSSFSKIMLGWTIPQVVTDSITLSIAPFESSGDCILIPKYWNGSYFTEYLLIEYYTPTGLNAPFAGNGLFSSAGVKIFHISAEIGTNTGDYVSYFKYDNSDARYKLIKYVEGENRNVIERKYNTNLSTAELNGILFYPSTVYDLSNYTWNDGTKIGFTVDIISCDSASAVIKILF